MLAAWLVVASAMAFTPPFKLSTTVSGSPEIDECIVSANSARKLTDCLAPMFGTPGSDFEGAYVNQRVRALARPTAERLMSRPPETGIDTVDECLLGVQAKREVTDCLAPDFGTQGKHAYVNQRVRGLATPLKPSISVKGVAARIKSWIVSNCLPH